MPKKAAQKKINSTGSAKKPAASKSKQKSPDSADYMSQCVALCQEQKWREALLLCRQAEQESRQKSKPEIYAGLQAAETKIDRSVRREMADALIKKTAELLQKEYLLDVSE